MNITTMTLMMETMMTTINSYLTMMNNHPPTPSYAGTCDVDDNADLMMTFL